MILVWHFGSSGGPSETSSRESRQTTLHRRGPLFVGHVFLYFTRHCQLKRKTQAAKNKTGSPSCSNVSSHFLSHPTPARRTKKLSIHPCRLRLPPGRAIAPS